MAGFRYRAKDKQGKAISGKLEALSEKGVLDYIQEKGWFPVEVYTEDHRKNLNRIGKLKTAELSSLIRQLAEMLGAGVSINKALTILEEQAEKPAERNIVGSLRSDVLEGTPLSSAMDNLPQVFPYYVARVAEAGEEGGMLPENLLSVANTLEKQMAFRQKLIQSLTYPMFLMLAGGVTVFFMVGFVIPRFMVLFKTFDQELPLPTQVLIKASQWVQHYWWTALMLILIGVLILLRIYRSKTGRKTIDHFLLELPLIGPIIRKGNLAVFTNMLSSLVGQGVFFVKAIGLSAENVNNFAVREKMKKISDGIKEGASLSSSLKESSLFSVAMISMLVIGEESGHLPDALKKVATLLEQDVDRTMKSSLSIIEPLLIFLLGGCVAFIVSAVLLPIFQIDVFK